jgi:hypothetical protein
MRWLANYFRQVFCAHDFERHEVQIVEHAYDEIPRNIRVSLVCKKCGYHRKFDKF